MQYKENGEIIIERGDWVVTKGYHPDYDGKALKIIAVVHRPYRTYNYFTSEDPRFTPNFSSDQCEVRPATQEEIKKVLAMSAQPDNSVIDSKSTFQIGAWVMITSLKGRFLVKHTNEMFTIGFDDKGRWEDGFNYSSINPRYDFVRLATQLEIEEALIIEATRRGYKSGTHLSSYGLGGIWTITKNIENGGFRYYMDGDELVVRQTIPGAKSLIGDNCHIYKNGEWRQIVKDPINIGAFTVEFIRSTSSIIVGCKEYMFRSVNEINDVMKKYDLSHITIEGVTVSKDTVNEIVERIVE